MNSRTVLIQLYDTYRICRHPDAATTTIGVYTAALAQFEAFLGRPPRVRDLTQDRLAAFLAWLAQSRKPDGANSYMRKLLALSRFAFRRRLLKHEPEIRLLKVPKEVPQAFRATQISSLLEAANLVQGEYSGIPARQYWFAKIQVLYWTGLRIGAAIQILRHNVDLEMGTIRVMGETQKQLNGQVFRVHPDCVEAIRQIWLPKRELLFPWPHTQRIMRLHFRKILKVADLPTTRYDLFQKIRRTTYSYSKLGGIDAGRQLGHSSDMSRYYEDPTITQERQACDVLPRPEPSGPKFKIVG